MANDIKDKVLDTFSGNDIGGAIDALKGALSKIKGFIQSLLSKLSSLPNLFGKISSIFTETVPKIEKFVEKVGKIPKMFQKASNGDNKIVNELINPTCSRISNLGDMFDIEYERTNAQKWRFHDDDESVATYPFGYYQKDSGSPKVKSKFVKGWRMDQSSGMFSVFVKSVGCRARIDFRFLMCKTCDCKIKGRSVNLDGGVGVTLVKEGRENSKGGIDAASTDAQSQMSCKGWVIAVDSIAKVAMQALSTIRTIETYVVDYKTKTPKGNSRYPWGMGCKQFQKPTDNADTKDYAADLCPNYEQISVDGSAKPKRTKAEQDAANSEVEAWTGPSRV